MSETEREGGGRRAIDRASERERELVGALSPLLTNQRQKHEKRKPKTIE